MLPFETMDFSPLALAERSQEELKIKQPMQFFSFSHPLFSAMLKER